MDLAVLIRCNECVPQQAHVGRVQQIELPRVELDDPNVIGIRSEYSTVHRTLD